jgi:hypothetical protein
VRRPRVGAASPVFRSPATAGKSLLGGSWGRATSPDVLSREFSVYTLATALRVPPRPGAVPLVSRELSSKYV